MSEMGTRSKKDPAGQPRQHCHTDLQRGVISPEDLATPDHMISGTFFFFYPLSFCVHIYKINGRKEFKTSFQRVVK
jgi:hypothetical protein